MKSVNELRPETAARGFTLIEMMIVIVIISIVVAAVLAQVDQTQQRATAEQGKLDQFQAARNFADQISSDARQMGYPNIHNFDPLSLASNFYIANSGVAVGLIKLTSTQLVFEGDVDGSGQVSIISYTVNGDGACANCLERAQVTKTAVGVTTNAAYLTWALNQVSNAGYTAEIQNVQNVNSVANPIFSAYNSATGGAITLPIDISSDPTDVAKVRTIQVSLDVSDPAKLDPKTRQALEANITSRIQIVNCSMATTGLATAGGIQLTCQ